MAGMEPITTILSRRGFVAALPLAFIACSQTARGGSSSSSQDEPAADAPPELVVYKTPACGCCRAWVDTMRTSGLAVRTIDVEDTAPIAARLGVPARLRSCHTGVIGGYAVEGHVPAREILRLLVERPAVAGLAVPGMPIGSPGMEMGDRRDPFGVIAFTRSGETRLFARY